MTNLIPPELIDSAGVRRPELARFGSAVTMMGPSGSCVRDSEVLPHLTVTPQSR